MQDVVERGTGAAARRYGVRGSVGGKTGTSENFDVEQGKYSGFTSSFVGMAPAENPRILTYVVVQDPQNGHTGGAVAGPVAWDMLRVALPRYGVEPSTGIGPKVPRPPGAVASASPVGASGGGKSSGLMSFLKIGDRAAGAIKSGGTTRRAAKMVVVDIDHPDIEQYINWKVKEEQKVAALVTGSKINQKHLKAVLKACVNCEGSGDDCFDPEKNPALRREIKLARRALVTDILGYTKVFPFTKPIR